MSRYNANVIWTCNEQNFLGHFFLDYLYSRKYVLHFDARAKVVCSSSRCHWLWCLSIATKHHFCTDRYIDQADGIVAKMKMINLS